MAHDRHKIIVGVDYGTTFTGRLPSKMLKKSTKLVKAPVMLALEERPSMILSLSSPGLDARDTPKPSSKHLLESRTPRITMENTAGAIRLSRE